MNDQELAHAAKSQPRADVQLDAGLSAISDPLLDPVFWSAQRLGAPSAWWLHVPFAHWIVCASRPNVLVELGTHTGVSYSAFCQAVRRAGLPTRCHAVDTWRGDSHSGEYDESVFHEFHHYHDEHFGTFSTLLRSTFDEALGFIDDGSVDLLHIDGLHTYDAARHDYEGWLPKLSGNGIVLFHDINERTKDFGVWRLWRELCGRHPSFTFLHGHGLGVLAVGDHAPESVLTLCRISDPVRIAVVRERFARLGERWLIDTRERMLGQRMGQAAGDLARLQEELVLGRQALAKSQAQERLLEEEISAAKSAALERALADEEGRQEQARRTAGRIAEIEANLQGALGRAAKAEYALTNAEDAWAKAEEARARAEEARAKVEADLQINLVRTMRAEAAAATLRAEHHAIAASTTWRATRPFRAVGGRLPPRLRSMLRAGVDLASRATALSKIEPEPHSTTGPLDSGPAPPPPAADVGIDQRSYDLWVRRHDTLSVEDRAAIHRHIASFAHRPLISVVMPVYETPPRLLGAAIDSVRAQLYPDWELCVADDASAAPEVAALLRAAAAADPRVKWVRREANGGIAAATNAALALASGEFVALLDHDDLLSEHALYEVAAELDRHPDADLLYSDEDKIDAEGRRHTPYFKTDWNPDLLLGHNMISHLGVYRRTLLEQIGGLRDGFDGSQDYDLALRATATTSPTRIRHLPAILYHWRAGDGTGSFSERQLERCVDSARRAIADHLRRRGGPTANAVVVPVPAVPTWTRVIWPLPDPAPRVSIIVPTRDRADLLSRCVAGLLLRTDYPDLELIVVDNDSLQAETLALFDRLRQDRRVRVLPGPGPFNYAALNNAAVREATGEIVVLVNNDVDVIDEGWLREMVSQAVRPEIGAVGAKLLYGDGTVQHAGTVLGLGSFAGGPGVAGHLGLHARREDVGYFGQFALVRDLCAVTGACLALRKLVYEAVGGLDAEHLAVAFNDVDLCLRIREQGLRILWTPFAELHHLESASRGIDSSAEKAERFAREVRYMRRRWGPILDADPFYNPNFSPEDQRFRLGFPPRRVRPWVTPTTARTREPG